MRQVDEIAKMDPLHSGDLCKLRMGVYLQIGNTNKVNLLQTGTYCIYLREERELDFRTGLKRIVHKFIASGAEVSLSPTSVRLILSHEDTNNEVQ